MPNTFRSLLLNHLLFFTLKYLYFISKKSLFFSFLPFLESLYKVIILLIIWAFEFQPSHPYSEGFRPLLIDVKYADVVGGYK